MPDIEAVSSLPRTGRITRGTIAGVAMARAGVAHLGHKARGLARSDEQQAQARAEHEAALGRILFSALNQLKGCALKASQLLSMELGFLPEAMRAELARAHYQVTPLNQALVIKVMRQAFGQNPDALFQSFEPQAFAAASLGQVHGATLAGGEPVAVKLQYPGMAASIGSDMRLLRSLLQTMRTGADRLPNAEIMERVLVDIEVKLAEELDYLHEAEQLVWFGQHLTLPGLVVPQPIMALTQQRVLTMQRLQGDHLNEWLKTQPSQSQRNHYGQLLFDTFMHCSFELHRLQADPHPGNYLFMPDGRLGLLDFGCTRTLDATFCRALARTWSAMLRDPVDADLMRQAYRQLGMIAPTLSSDEFASQLMPALAPLQRWQCLPFSQATYDFSQHPPAPRLDEQQHRQAIGYLHAMPPDLPYFDRAYLGLVELLKKLSARVRTRNRWIS